MKYCARLHCDFDQLNKSFLKKERNHWNIGGEYSGRTVLITWEIFNLIRENKGDLQEVINPIAPIDLLMIN